MGVTEVILIIALNVAIALAMALKPKTTTPEASNPNVPTAEEGTGVVEFYGTCWQGDSMVKGFKLLGTTAIKKKV